MMIEKIVDPSAPPEERAQRKRRLTKGLLVLIGRRRGGNERLP
jgi:hypothetical protein